MASIDYNEARKEIEKIFSSHADFGRHIIFWYDAPVAFKDDIIADKFDFCRLIICENNEFAVKKMIEKDDCTSNFLLYFPYEKPADNDNWLLDILLYSEEYYADTVALTMRRLNLSNTDLRHVIEAHIKFFDAEDRQKRLSNYIDITDKLTPEELCIAMMSVIVKAHSPSIEDILTELVFDSGSKYKDIIRFGFEDKLWDIIATHFNYEGDQRIEVLIKRFMFTALIGQKADFGEPSSFYSQYLIGKKGKNDARFFIDKLKIDKRFYDLQLSLSVDLKIESLLIPRDISCVETADIFECIDIHIIKKITESLYNGSLDYDNFESIIKKRINSHWYSIHKAEYDFLSISINLFRQLDIPIEKGLSSVFYIQNYTENYYLIDSYYRRACTSFTEIDNPTIEMEGLMDRIELFYQTKYLDVLGKEYSQALNDQSTWSFSGVDSTFDFYQKLQRNNYKKCFVIISDGLRYEIAKELLDKIRTDNSLKGTDELNYAISPLPSETRFGMAALLPHKEIQYINNDVFVDNNPTNSVVARDAVLKSYDSSYAAIRFDDLLNMTKERDKLRSYMSDKSLVYVYHNVIDNTGESDENNVFSVVPRAIDDILKLIKKLYSGLQISNYYITADHGFIYRRNSVSENNKYSDIFSLHSTETNRRYVISKDPNLSISYTLQFPLDNLNNEDYQVILPFGYDVFKAPGSGYQYFHGGASLQETIVPIIHIGALSSANSKEDVTPVGVRLKSITRKITNRSFVLEFEQYERVQDRKQAITCETYLVDEEGNKVSGEYKFAAASDSEDITQRVTKIRFNLMNIPFDRNQRYYLILKNADKPDEYIQRENFIIDILNLKIL